MSPTLNSMLGEMDFDSSLLSTMDTQLSATEYKERLEALLKPILSQRFINEIPKQVVKTCILLGNI